MFRSGINPVSFEDLIAYIVVAFVASYFVFRDASRKGFNSFFWTAVSFFFFPFAVIVYLVYAWYETKKLR